MPASSSNASRSPLLRKRKNEDKSEVPNDEQDEQSEEQLAAVEEIRRCKDYYDILGVSKDAGESDLRKQYRKLALQFHPDKNKTPGSAEAFKAIGNAFSVLNDPVKRKQYDTYGLEAMQPTQNHPAHEGYAQTFEGDITPEELFNIFFGGGNTYVRRGNQWQRYPRASTQAHQADDRSVLMQILPLLFIVSVSFLSSFFVSDPPYSLQRTPKFLYEQRTHNLDVVYFVRENFMNDYKGRIPYIEKQVEEEYLINLRSSCFRERNYKENMIWRAKHFRDLTLEEKARTLRTPSCDVLNDLYVAMHEV